MSTDAWSEQPTEATVALIAEPAVTALGLISRIGAATSCGSMSFTEALALQGSFYDDGTDDRRAVFQIDQLSGRGGQWWATVEPNGFRLAFARNVRTVAAGQLAASFFWNVNAVMRVVKVDHDAVVAEFDPLIDVDAVPEEARDLPFGTTPSTASIALLQRWTGVTITQHWFEASKPTLIVEAPIE